MNKKYLIIGVVVAIVAFGAFFLWPVDDVDIKNYVGRSAEECSRIQVLCIEGFERFDDKNGCGCQEVR